jgi:RNA polymerase sigma-70 factor (ECF subfamily)
MDEDRLLRAARQGEGAAFWQLAEAYRPYLRAVAARVLGGRLPSDGSDIVSHGLGVACERLAQFQGQQPAAFLGWLAAIVRNRALRSLRQAGRLQPLPAGSSDEDELPDDGSAPDEQASRREQAARLWAALQRLAEDDRTVIDLRNFQELPFPEVARRMGRSAEAVRQLWTRAVRRLREQLGDQS